MPKTAVIRQPDAAYQSQILDMKWRGMNSHQIASELGISQDRVGKILTRCYARCAGYDYDINIERYVSADRLNRLIGIAIDNTGKLQDLLESQEETGPYLAVQDRLDKSLHTIKELDKSRRDLLGLDVPVKKTETAAPTRMQINVMYQDQPIRQSRNEVHVIEVEQPPACLSEPQDSKDCQNQSQPAE